jgi:Na+/proline symporter
MSLRALSEPSLTTKLQAKIGWICQSLRWLMFLWLLWVLVLISLPLFDLAGTVDQINSSPHMAEFQITTQSYLASRIVSYLDWAAATLIGFAAWRLMTGYMNGDIFSENAADRLKRLGQAAIVATLADIIARPISIMLLSPGYFKTLSMWQFLAPQDLLYILIGAFILSLAKIYHVAAEINAENKSFI